MSGNNKKSQVKPADQIEGSDSSQNTIPISLPNEKKTCSLWICKACKRITYSKYVYSSPDKYTYVLCKHCGYNRSPKPNFIISLLYSCLALITIIFILFILFFPFNPFKFVNDFWGFGDTNDTSDLNFIYKNYLNIDSPNSNNYFFSLTNNYLIEVVNEDENGSATVEIEQEIFNLNYKNQKIYWNKNIRLFSPICIKVTSAPDNLKLSIKIQKYYDDEQEKNNQLVQAYKIYNEYQNYGFKFTEGDLLYPRPDLKGDPIELEGEPELPAAKLEELEEPYNDIQKDEDGCWIPFNVKRNEKEKRILWYYVKYSNQ